MTIQLRPYQAAAVAGIRQEFSAKKRSVLLTLPTGGGKTYTFSYIADGASAKGNRVLILAHRQELVMQASLSLANIGVKHSLVCAASTAAAIKVQHVREFGRCLIDPHAHVDLGSVQTAITRLDKIRPPRLIILDEAHHANAGQWREIIEKWPEAKVLGVTATPCRTDGIGLGTHCGGVFDAMVLGPTVAQLIALGNLVPPKVYFPGTQLDMTGVRTTKSGDWNRKQLSEKIASERPAIIGDAVEHYRKLAHGKKAVAFCASVEAAQKTAEAFQAAGYNFRSLDGSMDDSQRRGAVKALRDGELDGITSCDIVSEGFDLPALECAILLRPTQSLGLYLQQVGRVLRPSPGKTHGIIIDHVGNTIAHGLPHWDREWTLDGDREGKPVRLDDGPDVVVRVCPECFSVIEPRPVCPQCGHEFAVKARVIEQQAGQLQELDEAQEAILRMRQQQQKRREVGKAGTLEDLQRIEKERGYRSGWANHIWKSRQSRGQRAYA